DRVALAAKGRILLDVGRIPEALKAFEDGLILEHDNLDFLGGKATCLAYESHFDDALSLLAVVFQKDPNDYGAHRTKGLCLLRTDHAAEAIPCFEFALKANPNDGVALTWTGEAYAALGKTGAALKAFDADEEASPESVDAGTSKGLSLLRLKRFEEALKCFDAALALDPAFEAAQNGRATAEERFHVSKIENFAEAVVRFEKHLSRPATRDEVFRYCSVPLESL